MKKIPLLLLVSLLIAGSFMVIPSEAWAEDDAAAKKLNDYFSANKSSYLMQRTLINWMAKAVVRGNMALLEALPAPQADTLPELEAFAKEWAAKTQDSEVQAFADIVGVYLDEYGKTMEPAKTSNIIAGFIAFDIGDALKMPDIPTGTAADFRDYLKNSGGPKALAARVREFRPKKEVQQAQGVVGQ